MNQVLTFIYTLAFSQAYGLGYICIVKKIKHILFFAILVSALFAADSAQAAVKTSHPRDQEKQFSKDGIHSLAIIQPESVHHVVPHAKVSQPVVFRSANYLLFDIASFNNQKLQKSFIRQDINRCEKVSFLLFPHHFFW